MTTILKKIFIFIFFFLILYFIYIKNSINDKFLYIKKYSISRFNLDKDQLFSKNLEVLYDLKEKNTKIKENETLKTDLQFADHLSKFNILTGSSYIKEDQHSICNSLYLFNESRYRFLEVKGVAFHIFKPIVKFKKLICKSHGPLNPPEVWIPFLESFYDRSHVHINYLGNHTMTTNARARYAYLESLKSFVTASSYGSAEMSLKPTLRTSELSATTIDSRLRERGNDWPYFGLTMTGTTRIYMLEVLLIDVFFNRIEGGVMETGVWRGGSSIFARGVMRTFMFGNTPIYVCDSFSGLPPSSGLDDGDLGWDKTPFLEASDFEVAKNFHSHGLLDSNVIFVKGFFNESMPTLRNQVRSLSILRLDGDMYLSTVDVLYNMYDKLQIGGYLIMDDWYGFPSRIACLDFFQVHNFTEDVIRIDDLSAYWKKTKHVEIQYYRYKTNNFKIGT